MTKNTAVTTSFLVASQAKLPAAKKPYLDIPTGQVAVTVPAGGELQTVGGFIQPDDRVDILWSPSGDKWQVSFQNLKIAHVGGVAGTNTQGVTTSYIMFVSVDDAEALSPAVHDRVTTSSFYARRPTRTRRTPSTAAGLQSRS